MAQVVAVKLDLIKFLERGTVNWDNIRMLKTQDWVEVIIMSIIQMNKNNLPRDWKTLNRSKATLRKEQPQVFFVQILKHPSWTTNWRKCEPWARLTKWERIAPANSTIVEACLNWEMLSRKRRLAYHRPFQPKVLKKIVNLSNITSINSQSKKCKIILTTFRIITLLSSLIILGSCRTLLVQSLKISKLVENHLSLASRRSFSTTSWKSAINPIKLRAWPSAQLVSTKEVPKLEIRSKWCRKLKLAFHKHW